MADFSDTFQLFSANQIASLRAGGEILRECLDHCQKLVVPGIQTAEIDRIAEEFIVKRGGRPAFKGYHGFPATLCISINDEVVHGIPGKRAVQEGDIVSLDGGVIFDDLYTDACVTVGAGKLATRTKKFLDVTSKTLEVLIRDVVKPGATVGDLSAFIQKHLEKAGYSPVRALTGHGLGTTLHQFPDVPNWGEAGKGPVLPVHTMIAIEPIASMGSPDVSTDGDGWTIRTVDRSLSCHFEHSVLITETGCEIIA